MKRRQTKCSSNADTNHTSKNTTPPKTMKKTLTFVLRRMKPLPSTGAAVRWATSHTAATTTAKALATTMPCPSTPSSKTTTTTPRTLWWLSAQRRKLWLHDKSCRSMSTMVATTEYEAYCGHNSVIHSPLPPWQVGNLLNGRTPSEDDWWCRPDSIFATTALAELNVAADNGNDIFLSSNSDNADIFSKHRHQPDVVVKCKSQTIWVMDDDDDEKMITKETLTVSSSFEETPNSQHHLGSCSNYESLLNGSNPATLSDRLFRNYGNETWHKARAAWRCTSSMSPAAFTASATTSCWPMRASASTRPLEGREMNKLVQQFQQQATDAIGEYDLPRRIRLQDVVTIYSNIWKDTESDDEADIVVAWND